MTKGDLAEIARSHLRSWFLTRAEMTGQRSQALSWLSALGRAAVRPEHAIIRAVTVYEQTKEWPWTKRSYK